MHIEPGVVDGAKMVLAYGTAAAAAGYSLKLINDDLKTHSVASFGVRAVIAALLECSSSLRSCRTSPLASLKYISS